MPTIQHLEEFILSQESYTLEKLSSGPWRLTQKIDQKTMIFDPKLIKEIMIRMDPENESPFLQVNLKDKRKFLITQHFVGFKPQTHELSLLSHLPQVVTTVDLLTLSDAIEEILTSDSPEQQVELDVLKKAYLAITLGAEEVGFDMSCERTWILAQLNYPSANAA